MNIYDKKDITPMEGITENTVPCMEQSGNLVNIKTEDIEDDSSDVATNVELLMEMRLL